MTLEFEKPLLDMQQKIQELEALSQSSGLDMTMEISQLHTQAQDLRQKLYQNLSASQKLQVARHPNRPNFLELVNALSPQVWFELHGDRAGCDDRAILGGIVEFTQENGKTCPMLMVGMQKGRNMKENLEYNFGMANPEGYRKAMRLFLHAEKFNMPILTVIDTPGAYPGLHGEQCGIGHAIAHNIREMSRLSVPIISIVTGEASSGGALGIGVANHILMLEHALYTVISPEGCASILWRSADYAKTAADALKITAQDLKKRNIIDGIIAEPVGGAHANPAALFEATRAALNESLAALCPLSAEALREQRYQKYRNIGVLG